MLYFFSAPDESIQSFLNETEVTFRLSDSEAWGANTVIAQGATRTLTNFKANSFDGQKHENVVYLFFGNRQNAAMKVIVGLASDGEADTATLNLYKVSNVYFPDEDFYNCNIFPVQWMEIFAEGSAGSPDEAEGTKKPDFKIKNNLMILESVLEGKFDIQSSLLNLTQLRRPRNRRLFSNVSFLKSDSKENRTAPHKPPSARQKSVFFGRKKDSCFAFERRVNSLVPHKAFVIKKASSTHLSEANLAAEKWQISNGSEEGLYRDYLAMVRGKAANSD